ncbi:hypothetical protein BC936DRAFT_143816 [Jimgerdemannia flammicorona]|uniref:Uncharacterized protein n=1 Tax=Jimgerdemannia flammicorona TaxID=994334 RepID=A0A432ZYY1_9FUNG|nr:hypothetical protein BC936DRAFT_143816 [Jimgerdemannia flammicorona]
MRPISRLIRWCSPSLFLCARNEKLNVRPIPAPSTPHLMPIDPPSSSRRGVINSRNFKNLFQDDHDMNGTGDIPYEKLVIGKKLGSGGFKDCFSGFYQGVGASFIYIGVTIIDDLWGI